MSNADAPDDQNVSGSNGPDDYLWSASGQPDAEVAHLEQLLGAYRQSHPPAPLPVLERWREPLLWSWAFRTAAIAAVGAFLVLAAPWAFDRFAQPGDSCHTICVAGSPRANGRVFTGDEVLRGGGLLETDAASEAEIRFGLIGRVAVLPNSRVRLVEMRRGRYRMALERGKIAARTLAPPFTFVVDTPGPTAYDVGCAFTVETDEHGVGVLRVSSGWVQLELDAGEVLIPGGAESLLRPGGNLGTPQFADASEAFRAALARLDFEPLDAAARSAALTELLASARPRDVFTFQEMLRTVHGEERRRIVDRGLELLPAPPGVTRAGLLRGDEGMMNAWRRQLGLPQVKRWWLHWRDILPE